MIPAFFGLAGIRISDDERALFKACDPAGYILFKRNIDTPDQVRALTDSLRALSGNQAVPILIDQEGGRVARLRPPHWPEFPPPVVFGEAFAKAPLTAMAAARANGRDDLIITTVDLGENVAISMAQGGFIKGLGAQRPYDAGVVEAKLAGYALLGKDAPDFVALVRRAGRMTRCGRGALLRR